MTIAIDFDGTIVEHRYPKIGNEIPFATDTLKMLMKDHHRLILWTVREGELLKEAVEWCRERGVEFYAINRDYPEEDAAHHGLLCEGILLCIRFWGIFKYRLWQQSNNIIHK